MFHKFLKDNDCYDQFYTNRKVAIMRQYWEETPNEYDPKNFIMTAFEWTISPEGFDYWKHLHDIWKDMVLDDPDRYHGLTWKKYKAEEIGILLGEYASFEYNPEKDPGDAVEIPKVKQEPHKCYCDWKDVYNQGCKCGGV